MVFSRSYGAHVGAGPPLLYSRANHNSNAAYAPPSKTCPYVWVKLGCATIIAVMSLADKWNCKSSVTKWHLEIPLNCCRLLNGLITCIQVSKTAASLQCSNASFSKAGLPLSFCDNPITVLHDKHFKLTTRSSSHLPLSAKPPPFATSKRKRNLPSYEFAYLAFGREESTCVAK